MRLREIEKAITLLLKPQKTKKKVFKLQKPALDTSKNQYGKQLAQLGIYLEIACYNYQHNNIVMDARFGLNVV